MPAAEQTSTASPSAPGSFLQRLEGVKIKDVAVRARLAKPSHFTVHVTPSNSSWLNLVERFLIDPTGTRSKPAASLRSWNWCPLPGPISPTRLPIRRWYKWKAK